MDRNEAGNGNGSSSRGPGPEMRRRLATLGDAVGLSRASEFTQSVFEGFAAQPAERYEAVLADLSSLRAAFHAAPHRYCETTADELVREVRRVCGPETTPQEIVSIVGPREAVQHLARELLRRLAAAALHRKDGTAADQLRRIAELCRFLEGGGDDEADGGKKVGTIG